MKLLSVWLLLEGERYFWWEDAILGPMLSLVDATDSSFSEWLRFGRAMKLRVAEFSRERAGFLAVFFEELVLWEVDQYARFGVSGWNLVLGKGLIALFF